MYELVFKGYKYILAQIDDFLGKPSLIRISLKSKKGREKYQRIFGKKPKMEKKRRRKSRVIHYLQTRLTDFLDFVKDRSKRIWNRRRLPYKKKLRKTLPEDFVKEPLPRSQINAYKSYKGFKGYLNHLFLLNPFEDFFEYIQGDYTPQQEILNYENIAKIEIARCKLGTMNILDHLERINRDKNLRRELGIEDSSTLSYRSYVRNLRAIGSWNLRRLENRLREECRAYGLIGDKIWIWDRRFFQCRCAGQKDKSGLLSDPEAGFYVKKISEHKILKGTGYTDSGFVDSWWDLPTYYEAVGAHHNDNKIFRDTLKNAFKLYRPLIVVLDAGADSEESNNLVKRYGVIPVIVARKNSVGDIIQIDNHKCFRANHIPRELHFQLKKLFNNRTIIERRNANEIQGYNRSAMPTRGMEWANIFVSVSDITALLTGLTAYKVGRSDLIRSPTAFRKISPER